MASSKLDDLEQAVRSDPGNADLRHLLGAQYAQAGEYERAVQELLAATELNPSAHVARLQLGLLHLTHGSVPQALSSWGPLEILAEDSPIKLFKRGLEALVRNEFAVCARLLSDGIARNPQNQALNDDMRRVLNRLTQQPGTPKIAAEPGEKVRTDFSLYTPTRH
jgi:tetratricopeptide (TPR) repeat protein